MVRKMHDKVNGLVPTEHAEQVALFAWARTFHPREADFMFACPNGGYRAVREAIRLKAEGVSPGFPDLGCLLARGPYHGCFIEMKRTKNSRTSQEQTDWGLRLTTAGYFVRVCRGVQEAKDALSWYWSQPTLSDPLQAVKSFGQQLNELLQAI
jgi:hypothetical protein